MNVRSLSKTLCIFVAGLSAVLLPGGGVAHGAANDKPKVILLGFDGADATLTRQFMDEGVLPNLKALAERGSFSPLGTSNPAQSPVSWAVLETASNPGKTNIPDFVRRVFGGKGAPMPEPTGTDKLIVSSDQLGDHVPLRPFEKLALSLTGGKAIAFLVIGALGLFGLLFLVSRAVLRLPTIVATLIGLTFAGGFAFLGHRFVGEIPARFPLAVSQMQGTRFWDVLDGHDVRFVGLQVPAAFPCVTEYTNSRLLGGLFTPDVVGGTGSWYVYTNDEWASNGMDTPSGGTVYKLYPDKDTVIRSHLRGPNNFFREQELSDQIAAVKQKQSEPGLSDADQRDLADTLSRLESDQSNFESYEKKVKAPIEVRPDYAGRKVAITIDGVTQTVPEGAWTNFYRVTFEITRLIKVKALVQFYVQECSTDPDEIERLRLFVPPISISPEEQPPMLPISSPRDFARELADDIGMYDTLGWACWTSAIKDQELPEAAFMSGLQRTMEMRTKQFMHELDRDDWDVLFHVESITDRACHMLYRFIDPQHPQYDVLDPRTKLPLRDTVVTAFGRSFPLKDGIRETYREMDKITGEVLKRLDAGKFGDQCNLMIVSDHGFQSFRWGVELNTWLARNGYLKILDQEGFKPGELNDIPTSVSGGYLTYVDWANTTAYSLGLGKIFINLKGREPLGIVDRQDFDRLRREIIGKLESFIDPIRGGRVVRKAYDGQEIYEGRYKEEPGDIVLGFEAGYRVSWDTSAGGFDASTAKTFGIADNPVTWSGDHVGVDPELVKGIFLSNRKLVADFEPNLINIAPAILKLYGIERPKDWDGQPFDLK